MTSFTEKYVVPVTESAYATPRVETVPSADPEPLYMAAHASGHTAVGRLDVPPEHDLFFFAGDDGFRDIFLPNYEAEYRPLDLDGELLSFCYYLRGFEDMIAYFARILRGDGGAIQDQADLEEITGYLTGLTIVEASMAGIVQR